jgi:hypothetical protein
MAPDSENSGLRWLNIRTVIGAFLLVTLGVTIQSYTNNTYNNYLVFTRPLVNLQSCLSLYRYYHSLYEDVFRYSPTFALLAGSLSHMNDFSGLLVWNLLNTGVFVSGLVYFLQSSGCTKKTIIAALILVFLEWLISCQNSQSNGLVAGLILWGIALLRKEKPILAALMLSLCGFIKFYGLAAAVIFLFFPKKIKFLGSMFIWCLILSILPLTVVSLQCLKSQYIFWIEALQSCPVAQQVSVMGIVQYWFSANIPYSWIQLAGFVAMLLPLVRMKRYQDVPFQNLFLGSVLLYVVIFNMMAESPTYIIALAGVALWYSSLKTINPLDIALIVLVLVLSSMSSSDLFPKVWRQRFFVMYSIKALPCLLVWLRIQYLLWSDSSRAEELNTTSAL